MSSSPEAANPRTQEHLIVLHRLDKRTNICAEVEMPSMMADFAVRLARMTRGPCAATGFSKYVETRSVSNRFGTFTARFFSRL